MREKAQRLAANLRNCVGCATALPRKRTQLSRDLPVLANEMQRMSLLIEERQKRQAEAEKALEGERQRAAALARQVDNLKDFDRKLEQGARRCSRGAGVGTCAGRHKSDNTTNLAALKEPGRMQPALAFARDARSLRGRLTALRFRLWRLRRPRWRGKGISSPPRAGAQVTGPATAGWSTPDRSAPTDNS